MPDKVDKWTVKRKLQESRVYGYEVAEELKITESGLSKRLRNPSAEQAAEIMEAINRISAKRAAG